MYRIIYEIAGGRHTFWSKDYQRGDDRITATDVETGQRKIIGNATPHVITEVDSVPPRIEEAIVDD